MYIYFSSKDNSLQEEEMKSTDMASNTEIQGQSSTPNKRRKFTQYDVNETYIKFLNEATKTQILKQEVLSLQKIALQRELGINNN